MEAEAYAGSGKVYSKTVNLSDVAWIDPTQGQYAKIDDADIRYSVDTNADEHTPQQQRVIDEYEAAVDSGLIRYMDSIKDGRTRWYYRISKISDRAAHEIKSKLGTDVSGSYNTIDKYAIEHIENDHGANGTADQSMADSRDIARIGYVLDNYDTMTVSETTDWRFKNKDNTPAKKVVFEKRIDGSYYVVEAVADTGRLSVITAYKNKASEVSDVQNMNPGQTSDNALPNNASTDNISQNNGNVKSGVYTSEINKNDIADIQSVGRKSINDFDEQDRAKTNTIAQKYYKEMGEKSPFFRAWFGDWRENDKTPVHIATEKGAVRGVTKNNDTGWDIQVSGKVFNETQKHTSQKAKNAVPYIDYINSIVENAVLLDSYTIGKAKSENSVMMHSFYALGDNGNGVDLLKLYVEEMYNPNTNGTDKRSYQLQMLNKMPLTGTKFNQNGLASLKQQHSYTVSDLFALVKSHDKNFSPQNASKVVNADGTPKVVYHGTLANGLHEFKKEFIGSRFSFDDTGFFFVSRKSIAEDYATSEFDAQKKGEVIPAYLNIKNPFIFDREYALSNGYGNVFKSNDVIDIWDAYQGAILDDVERGQYNGIIINDGTDQMYVVFEPNQIKSATDNIGTFDKNNPDMF